MPGDVAWPPQATGTPVVLASLSLSLSPSTGPPSAIARLHALRWAGRRATAWTQKDRMPT
eukprot:9349333-Pyramimonas_sp.AAC.1